MTKLTVHIGCAKGGSSAIQHFLGRNSTALAERGTIIPTVDLLPGSRQTGQQIEFFQGLIEGGRARPSSAFETRLADLTDGGAAGDHVIISAENLCNPVGFERVFEAVAADFDVRVLMYVRRQDDYLESAWQQWYLKQGRALSAWLIENVGTLADWSSMVTPWAEVLGDDRVTVRRFDRASLVGGDVVADFCDQVGIDMEGLAQPRNANLSYDARVSRMLEGRPHLFEGEHDHRFYDDLVRLTDGGVHKTAGAPRLFSTDERTAIMVRYEAANEQLRRRFLPHVHAPLFPAPEPQPSAPPEGVPAFERDLLQRQILNLHRRLTALEG